MRWSARTSSGIETKWTKDYDAKHEARRQGIMSSATLHFPDYSLQWYLHCDASNQACGCILLQEHVDPVTKTEELQVIVFVSTKFSGSAALLPTNKKECYSFYYSVKELTYYLQCKEFILQMNHYNLLYMEKSTQSILQRWRLYLQAYSFQLQHIQGKANVFADYLSRMYHVYASKADVDPISRSPRKIESRDSCLSRHLLPQPRPCLRLPSSGTLSSWGTTTKTTSQFFLLCPNP
jgi:hypothetical protein